MWTDGEGRGSGGVMLSGWKRKQTGSENKRTGSVGGGKIANAADLL